MYYPFTHLIGEEMIKKMKQKNETFENTKIFIETADKIRNYF